MVFDSSVSLTEKFVSNWWISWGTMSAWSAFRLLNVSSIRIFCFIISKDGSIQT